MKKLFSSLSRLAIIALSAFPAITVAAPPSTSPYYTDTTNSYVHDQTSEVMSQLNGILCYMSAMAPSQEVNAGNYIALIDQNTCEERSSGGQSNNTGPSYTAAVVNSTRASSTDPMLAKVWVSPQQNNNIAVYATATEAPSATLPYGVFRMDYCGDQQGVTTGCATDKGFINATTSGLSFYSEGTHGPGNSDMTKLFLNATSTTAGSGAISESHTWNGSGGGSNFLFAYNANFFVRNKGGADVCFDRDPLTADESVWRYGLYDATTGAQVTRQSGFPVEYTDTSVTPNVTYNGYIGYYGLWMQGVTVPSGATLNQVTYGNSGATKTPYTLLKTGGKLSKFTTVQKTLADLNKVTFWYFAQANIPATGTPAMTAGSQYELYWNDTAQQFYVSGMQNPSTNNMEHYATPVAVANADMRTANPWGLQGWSQMMGGQFGIKGNDFANLTGVSPSTIPVRAQIQDLVYPSQYASIGNLKCINDCPTAALIASSNGGSGSAYANSGWNPVASGAFVTYTLDGTTGNLVDPLAADVVSTATSGTNANGVRSGRLVTAADAAIIITAKNGFCNNCGTFNQGDVDFLTVGSSYYVWETGANNWNQLALLMNGSTPVTFDPPLPVNFVVPSGAKYGGYAGATISLQYGGFGDLWGIPNECVDITTNAACDFTQGTGTAQNNQRWTSKFTIPFNATTGVVTASGTQYLVKPLDKEIRLAKVSCVGTGLSTVGLSNTGLPTVADFIDPTTTVGTKPTVTDAPKVIHGVVQY